MSFLTIFRRVAGGLAFAAAACAYGEVGITSNTVIVGQSAALTGPAKELGLDMRMGVQTYFDQVNKSGGVHGRKLVLKSLDDGYEATRAAANTKTLINQDGAFALLGYVGTPTSEASKPIFTEARVPFVGAFTGAELLRAPFNRYIFNVRASYYDETEAIVNLLANLGMTRIAVFYQNDSYGKAGLTGVERAMTKRNMKIAATGTVERNTTEVSVAVKEISKVDPQAVVMISAYKSVAAFVTAMKKMNSNPQFMNVSFVGSKALATELGETGRGVGISQVVPFPWNLSAPVVKEYQRNFVAHAGNDNYNFSSLEGYIAAKVLVEGLRRAPGKVTREGLIAGLESIDRQQFGGFEVSFSPRNHVASKFVELSMITGDGRIRT